MNLNLAVPYNPKPSAPHEANLVFYSRQKADLLFNDEKEIELFCQAGFRNVGLSWTLARNSFKQPFSTGTAESLAANCFLIRIPSGALKPGFFDLRVQLDLGEGTTVPGICTFGYQQEKMPITSARPPDFKSFWDAAKEKLSQVPLKAEHGPLRIFAGKEIDAYNLTSAALPRDYDPAGHRCETVVAHQASFSSVDGSRVHGCLAKPRGKGPFPTMLVLPGAGFAARPMPLEHARHGYLALDIQVHGQEVDLPQYPRLPGYYEDWVFEPPENYYFYKVHLHCLQALHYLFSRPDVDKSRVVVVGGSQGGRLAIVLAALDSRIAAAVSAIANGGNVPYQTWANASNSSLPPSHGMDRDFPPPLPNTDEGRCMGYYDPMSFAPDVHCPILFNAGLIDPISPPAGIFALYQLTASAEKTMVPLPGLAHDWSSEFDRQAWRWLDRVLKISAPENSSAPPTETVPI